MKNRYLCFQIFFLALLLGGPTAGWAQSKFFADAPDLRAVTRSEKQVAAYRVYRLDVARLRAYLANAPVEFTADRRPAVNLAVPLPNGSTETFAIYDSPVLAPAVAAQHPDIKTYTGRATSGAPATIRFSLMSDGFNAVVLDLAGGASAYFEKSAQAKEDNVYLSYSSLDVRPLPRGPGQKKAQCGVPAGVGHAATGGVSPVAGPAARLASSGATLRTFRLAVAATGEFTANFGGTPATAFNALVGYVNRMVGVYRHELSVSFTLVSGTNVVYPDAATDPYTPANQSTMLTQNQANLDAVVGSANYDLGHVIDYAPAGTSGGGLALGGSACDNASKGQGVSQVIPVGGAFPVIFGDQTFDHEVGHQVGMSHSFNSSIPVCTTRNQPTAVEPGAGTTIMSYGYTCSDATGDDNYEAAYSPILNFHAVNIQEANTFLATVSCYTSTNPGNAVPAITSFTTGRTIPKSTPFALTGTATDANPADVLSYSWEGMDAGAVAAPGPGVLADESQAPFFRSYSPVAAGTRLFPRLSAILDGTNKAKGDKLPSVGTVTNLRLTVRDGVGGVNEVNSMITVDGNSGPFLITSNLTGSYAGNTAQTVTWSVNNTAAAPVSCANVDILLSTDGGQTFPYRLATATPNDGTESVMMPALSSPTTTARLKVQASNNIFFDISNADFAVTAPLNTLSTDAIAGSPFCAGTAVSVPYSATGTFAAGNTFEAQLSDATGGFGAPVAIGSVSSTASGSIAATIPAGTASGSGYRIRVVSSNPGITGSDNGANLTITAPAVATFSYGAASQFCTTQTAAQAAVAGAGATLGSFSVSPVTGLALNPTTGAITPSTSTPGTYTVTNTVAANGGCGPATATTTVTITAPTPAGFSYAATAYCTSATSTASVVLAAGASAGAFNSTSGLTLNATTGAITPSTSTPGTYTVTNTVAASGGCAATTGTATVTITAPQSANIGYGAPSYCTTTIGSVALGIGTGSTLGTITVNPATGLTIAANGAITPATSTPGTYFVTNTVAASGGCAAATGGTTVTITAPQSAAFAYPTTSASYCAGTTTALMPTLGAGATAGTFALTTGTSTGATVNPSTGAVNLSAATAGTFTVTNTLAASGGCAAVVASQPVTVQPLPAVPVLTINSNQVSVQGGAVAGVTYQFFRNGVAMGVASAAATYQLTGATASGQYTVVATSAAGCTSAPSAPVAAVYLGTATALTSGATLFVYPNPAPAGGGAVVELRNWTGTPATLTLYDALGRTVLVALAGTTHLKLTGLAAGVYLLRAQAPNQQATRRLVVE